MGVRVGALTLYPVGGPYIYVCVWVFFSVAVELCSHPLLLLGVG